MKKLKSVFLFLFILSPLPVLCGCEPGTVVSDAEIAAINNGQYDFKYGRVDIAHDTYLLINWNKERDTYYQVGPVVFKCPYDFKIIVKSIYTDASYYLREAYKDGRYNESQLAYIGIVHRQYMKHITGKSGIEFNTWYDDNNQRMERSNYSKIDYEEMFKSAFIPHFQITLKHEESIKCRWYEIEEFSNIEGIRNISNYTHYYDRDGNYNVTYEDKDKYVYNNFKVIDKDTRSTHNLYINFKTIDEAKKIEKQIKSYSFIYDVTLQPGWSSWSIDI